MIADLRKRKFKKFTKLPIRILPGVYPHMILPLVAGLDLLPADITAEFGLLVRIHMLLHPVRWETLTADLAAMFRIGIVNFDVMTETRSRLELYLG